MRLLIKISTLAAVLIGLSLPSLISGRAVMGAFLSLGMLGIFMTPGINKRMRKAAAFFLMPLGKTVIVLMFIWLFGVFFSISIADSIQVWIRIVIFILCAIIISQFLREDEKRMQILLGTIVISAVFMFFLSLLGMLVFPDLVGLIKAKPIPDVTLARLRLRGVGSLAGLLVPFLAWATIYLGGRWRYIGGVVLPLLFVFIYLSGSQSAIAGLLASGFIVFVCSALVRRPGRGALIVGGAIIILIAGVLTILSGIPGGITSINYAAQESGSDLYLPIWLVDAHRQIIWQHVLDLALQKPWFGWGINKINYADMMKGQDVGQLGDLTYSSSHPHNWIIEVFSETGIIGLAPLLAVVFLLFWLPFASFRRTGDPALLSMLAVSAGFWTSGLFNFSFWSAWWQVSYLLLLAILVAAARDSTALSGKR